MISYKYYCFKNHFRFQLLFLFYLVKVFEFVHNRDSPLCFKQWLLENTQMVTNFNAHASFPTSSYSYCNQMLMYMFLNLWNGDPVFISSEGSEYIQVAIIQDFWRIFHIKDKFINHRICTEFILVHLFSIKYNASELEACSCSSFESLVKH